MVRFEKGKLLTYAINMEVIAAETWTTMTTLGLFVGNNNYGNE